MLVAKGERIIDGGAVAFTVVVESESKQSDGSSAWFLECHWCHWDEGGMSMYTQGRDIPEDKYHEAYRLATEERKRRWRK